MIEAENKHRHQQERHQAACRVDRGVEHLIHLVSIDPGTPAGQGRELRATARSAYGPRGDNARSAHPEISGLQARHQCARSAPSTADAKHRELLLLAPMPGLPACDTCVTA